MCCTSEIGVSPISYSIKDSRYTFPFDWTWHGIVMSILDLDFPVSLRLIPDT